MSDFKLEREIDHGHGKLRKGCSYSTVEAMLKHRYETGSRFYKGMNEAQRRLRETPCKRLMLQQAPFDECFPETNCVGCDCWRRKSYQEALDRARDPDRQEQP